MEGGGWTISGDNPEGGELPSGGPDHEVRVDQSSRLGRRLAASSLILRSERAANVNSTKSTKFRCRMLTWLSQVLAEHHMVNQFDVQAVALLAPNVR